MQMFGFLNIKELADYERIRSSLQFLHKPQQHNITTCRVHIKCGVIFITVTEVGYCSDLTTGKVVIVSSVVG